MSQKSITNLVRTQNIGVAESKNAKQYSSKLTYAEKEAGKCQSVSVPSPPFITKAVLVISASMIYVVHLLGGSNESLALRGS